VDHSYAALFDEPTHVELELLEFADGAAESSRLACQLVVSPHCDGVCVTVAPQ
jgi:ferredoxin